MPLSIPIEVRLKDARTAARQALMVAAGKTGEAQGNKPLDFVVFEVGGQRYGLSACVVRELVRAVTITALPKAPAIIEGVIDVRGTVVPVLDIRARFRLPAKPVRHTDHLILAHAGERLVALRADSAVGLVPLEASQIDAAAQIAPTAEYLAGVAKLADGLVLIHDLETFLTEAEAEGLDEALTDRDGKVRTQLETNRGRATATRAKTTRKKRPAKKKKITKPRKNGASSGS